MDVELRKMLRRMGMDYFNKFYGDYNGVVADNADPDKMGRVKLKVPAIYGNSTHEYWATAKGIPNGSGEGMFWVPKVGDNVLVSFENGNCRFPMWQHSYWGTVDHKGNSVVSGMYDDDGNPTKRILTTAAGQRLVFDDTNKITSITDANGHNIILDQDAISLVATDLIALGAKNATHPAVLGDKYKDLLDAILDQLEVATVTVSGSPVPLNNSAVFASIKTTLVEPSLSELVKLKK